MSVGGRRPAGSDRVSAGVVGPSADGGVRGVSGAVRDAVTHRPWRHGRVISGVGLWWCDSVVVWLEEKQSVRWEGNQAQ